VHLEADIAPVLDSGLRRNDEIELLNCLIIKCQHCLVSPDLPVPDLRVVNLERPLDELLR
jgi:hypothetical protein